MRQPYGVVVPGAVLAWLLPLAACSPSKAGTSAASVPAPEPRITARVGLAVDPTARAQCLAYEQALAEGKPVKLLPPDRPVTVRAMLADVCTEPDAVLGPLGVADPKKPCFVNMFVGIEEYLVVDRATSLMWESRASDPMSLPAAQAYVRAANKKRARGHADWRLPTLEEIGTLLESAVKQPYRLDPTIFWGRMVWLADSCKQRRCQWVIDTEGGPLCLPPRDFGSMRVMLVRTVGAGDFPSAGAVEAGLVASAEARRQCLAAERAHFVAGHPQEVRPRATPAVLRSKAIEVDPETLAKDLQGRGLYVPSDRGAGTCFNNQLMKHADGTIGDLATGLAWEPGFSARGATLPQAEARREGLNRARYLGHADWRLPTTEEALTLVESVQFYQPASRLDPGFLDGDRTIWLADRTPGGKEALLFSLAGGTIFPKAMPFDDPNAMKLVRSAGPPPGGGR